MNPVECGRRNEASLVYEEVATLLVYDGENLIWRVNRGGTAKAGSIAGGIGSNGYIQVKISGVRFKAHRVVWLLVHRRWPTDQLDHIDGNPRNNDIANLREVSLQENNCNRKLTCRNTSGVAGVYWHGRDKKWCAQIKLNQKLKSLGGFDNFEKAVAARRAAERRYGFHPNHGLDDEMCEVLYG